MPLSPFAVHRGTRAMSRSVLSVVMGYITLVVLVILTFAILSFAAPEFVHSGPENINLLITTLVSGWGVAIPAGFVTAYLSKKNEYEHVVVLLGAMITLGIVSMYIEQGAKPIWWHVGMMIGVIPFVFFGAWLRMRKKKKPRALLGRLLHR